MIESSQLTPPKQRANTSVISFHSCRSEYRFVVVCLHQWECAANLHALVIFFFSFPFWHRRKKKKHPSKDEEKKKRKVISYVHNNSFFDMGDAHFFDRNIFVASVLFLSVAHDVAAASFSLPFNFLCLSKCVNCTLTSLLFIFVLTWSNKNDYDEIRIMINIHLFRDVFVFFFSSWSIRSSIEPVIHSLRCSDRKRNLSKWTETFDCTFRRKRVHRITI